MSISEGKKVGGLVWFTKLGRLLNATPLCGGVSNCMGLLRKTIIINCDKLRLEVKVKLATVEEGDQKAPFSIATQWRGRGGC